MYKVTDYNNRTNNDVYTMIQQLDLPRMCWPGWFWEYPSHIHLLSPVAISWQGAFNGKTSYFFGKNNSRHGICLSTFCSEGGGHTGVYIPIDPFNDGGWQLWCEVAYGPLRPASGRVRDTPAQHDDMRWVMTWCRLLDVSYHVESYNFRNMSLPIWQPYICAWICSFKRDNNMRVPSYKTFAPGVRSCASRAHKFGSQPRSHTSRG